MQAVDTAMNTITARNVNVIASNSRGFTLLEALIALLVLSIGLLGLAGLQLSSARLGYEAHMRSITTVSASEIIERIRMRTYKLDVKARPQIISQYVGLTAGACDPSLSTIVNDFSCWQQHIAEELPEGEGRIIDADNTDGIFEVQISWYDRENEQPSTVSWTFIAGAL
jgi:type IV pilus assembly protein PilV